MLKFADHLSFPIEAATQTFAFIAKRGGGKTYSAGKLTELLLDAKVQVVVLDTVGNWYGLRLDADGKHPGYDVPVLGGLRGDIPLEAHGGALIADIVVDTGRPLVLDLSQFSLGDRKRFATAFGERLWLRKKGESHPAPLHLVIEESQLIVPQFTGRGGDEARMLGIYEEIIRLGRNYGIGVSMITQRPQSVNKEVLNQTECLLVGQVNGSQERDALKKWIVYQGMDVHLVDELPGLSPGTFYVWSPQWLNILKKVHVLQKRTYDASATPKVGDRRAQRDLKPLDLDDLKQRMAETIERAKQTDPRELRKRIAELEREVANRPVPEVRTVETPILSEAERTMLQGLTSEFLANLQELFDTQGREVLDEIRKVRGVLDGHRPVHAEISTGMGKNVQRFMTRPDGPKAKWHEGVRAEPARELPIGESKVLTLIAQHPMGVTRQQVTTVTGYKKSTRDAYLHRLRDRGAVDEANGRFVLTSAGKILLGSSFEPLPSGRALLEYWLDRLPVGEKTVLDVVARAYPKSVDREMISQKTEYKKSSRDAYLHRLAARELVAFPATGLVELREELA